MQTPIASADVLAASTRGDGSITYEFDRTKAAESLKVKMRLAIEVFDSREDKPEIWYYDNGYWHSGGAHLIDHFINKAAGNESNVDNVNDVLRRLRSELRLNPVEFDITNPYLVGCKDGITLDLRTSEARKGAPMDFISMPIPVKYDPKAQCPKFIGFMESVTATDDDRLSIIDFLASLLIAQPMDFFVAAPGLGSNGRSVLKDFIRSFVGSDTCRSIPLKNLSDRFTAGFLTRCRVNFCNETEIGGIILEFIKRSGEKMPVEQKYKGMVNASLYLKYFFDTNTMPAIKDTSYGAERRLCKWDLPWRFVDNPGGDDAPMEKQRDPDILIQITTPEELSGVLNLVLQRAPEVIRRRIIHHRAGGLQEYALQSRSGDIFLELFIAPTGNDNDKVHIEAIRKSYEDYCTVTNSNLLGSKSLKTLINDHFSRQIDRNVKIDGINRSGYKGLKFDKDLFKGTITTLEKARKEGQPVFSVLLKLFPDLENSTNSAKFYQILPDSTTENTISILYSRIVEKYREKKTMGNKEGNEDGNFSPENSQPKNSTLSTFSTKEATDIGNGGRVKVEFGRESRKMAADIEISPVVKGFLSDGGKSSLDRFLAEFPEAAE